MHDKRITQTSVLVTALAAVMVLGTPHAMASTSSRAPRVGGTASASDVARSLGPLGPLTDLVIERIEVGDDVAAAKYGTDSPIEDPAREDQVLEDVRHRAVAIGIDAGEAADFFQHQIDASKIVQRGLFARWDARPTQAPTTRPDLSVIRTELDGLTTRLLQQLKATQAIRHARLSCTVHSSVARLSGASLHRFDTLHRTALSTATRTMCSTS